MKVRLTKPHIPGLVFVGPLSSAENSASGSSLWLLCQPARPHLFSSCPSGGGVRALPFRSKVSHEKRWPRPSLLPAARVRLKVRSEMAALEFCGLPSKIEVKN